MRRTHPASGESNHKMKVLSSKAISATVRRLATIAYLGLHVGTQRFNNVRMSAAGLQARDCYTGVWSLLDVEEMTDHNGRKVSL